MTQCSYTFNCVCTALTPHTCTHAYTHAHRKGRGHAHTPTVHACSKNIFIRETFQLFLGSEDNDIGLTAGGNEGYSAHRQTSLPCFLSLLVQLADHHQGCYLFPQTAPPSHGPLLCLAHPGNLPTSVLSPRMCFPEISEWNSLFYTLASPRGPAAGREGQEVPHPWLCGFPTSIAAPSSPPHPPSQGPPQAGELDMGLPPKSRHEPKHEDMEMFSKHHLFCHTCIQQTR